MPPATPATIAVGRPSAISAACHGIGIAMFVHAYSAAKPTVPISRPLISAQADRARRGAARQADRLDAERLDDVERHRRLERPMTSPTSAFTSDTITR